MPPSTVIEDGVSNRQNTNSKASALRWKSWYIGYEAVRGPVLLPKWGDVDQIMTSRSGSCTGSKRSTSWSSNVKTAVFAPMPSASDRTAMVVNKRIQAELARAVAYVAPKRLERRNRLHFSPVLPQQSRVAKLAPRRRIGIAGRHARADVSFRQQAQVRCASRRRIQIRVSLAEQPFQFRRQNADRPGGSSCGHCIEDSMGAMECP